MRKALLPVSLLLSTLTLSGAVYAAGTATTTLDVTAIVGTACSVSTTPVDFGFVDPLGGVVAEGTITTTCTPDTAITIALDGGLNSDFFDRFMSDGSGNLMPYWIFEPDTFGPWGDDSLTIGHPSLLTASNPVDGVDVFPVLAEIPLLGTPVPDGFYSDVINVTVTY